MGEKKSKKERENPLPFNTKLRETGLRIPSISRLTNTPFLGRWQVNTPAVDTEVRNEIINATGSDRTVPPITGAQHSRPGKIRLGAQVHAR